MFTGDNTWSLGVLIGLPVVLIVLAALIFGVFYTRHRQTQEGGEWFIGMWICVALTAILIVGSLLAYYPYKAEYHQWRQISGTVTDVEKRLVPAGDNGMQEKLVVTYEGGAEMGCLDTRCASIEPGDMLTLTCKRTWQYTGTDGYDCNFVSKEEGTS